MLSPYAVSKLGGELYCNAFYENFGVPVSVVRYSNVFGIGQRPDNPYCGVIGKFFASAIEGKPLQIHGDGAQTRDYTYIDDAVDATLLAAIRPRAEGEVFNVGTGHRDLGQRPRPEGRRGRRRRGRHRPHRPPRHRQHPPPRREHREGPPDAPLGAPDDLGQRPRRHGSMDADTHGRVGPHPAGCGSEALTDSGRA